MNAIEFQTTITNSFVQIPNYAEFENKQVRIIVIDNTNTNTSYDSSKIDKVFDKFNLDVNAYTFNRDEANER